MDAARPSVCAGVPQQPLKTMTGKDLTKSRPHGRWNDRTVGFSCAAWTGAHDGPWLFVTQEYGEEAGPTEHGLLTENPHHLRIRSTVTGCGVACQTGNLATGRWPCGDTLLAVQLGRLAHGRDGAQDVETYLASMLPWACAGAAAPS